MTQEKKKKNPCTVCKGQGYLPAVGAWRMEGDTDPCLHCGGSGEEPEKKVSGSSPLEEDGFCMTENDP